MCEACALCCLALAGAAGSRQASGDWGSSTKSVSPIPERNGNPLLNRVARSHRHRSILGRVAYKHDSTLLAQRSSLGTPVGAGLLLFALPSLLWRHPPAGGKNINCRCEMCSGYAWCPKSTWRRETRPRFCQRDDSWVPEACTQRTAIFGR